MGNSAETAPGIALPKGGGALQGIGEKFSPDLHTGTGNFSVPLTLPPGRNGFAPQLSLAYTTGAGNGPFGLGFSLSVPAVTRRTAKGVPRYRDGAADERLHDVFILSGAEDLVPVATADGVTGYRPRTEGLFARIERHSAAPDHWVVRTKDGLVSRYGVALPGDPNRAVIADPAEPGRIFAWKLSETLDPFGNRIEYRYERDRVTGLRSWDQLYLKQIRYADYPEGDATKYLVTIDFNYEERPDPFSDCRAGFEIRTRRRCTRIAVWTHADADRLVRTYDLVYLDQRPELASAVPRNRVSLLSRVQVTGHDGEEIERLAPLDFGYTGFNPDRRRLTRLEGRALPMQSFTSGTTELVDLFGHGLPDILQMDGTVRYWRNLGSGRFDMPREMSTAPAGLTLAAAGVQLVDADGDGRTDLLVTQATTAGYYPLSFSGGWDARSFQPYDQAPSFDLEDPDVRLLDLNGDGVTDAVRAGARLECFFSDPERGWSETIQTERRALAAFPNVNFSDPRVKWADMSGDGLQDVVLFENGGVDYWPSRGWGDWGPRIAMRNSPRLPYGYDPRRVLLGDVDGDGAADLLYVEDGTVTLWLNLSGTAWNKPIVIRGTPTVSDVDSVRLADVLGNGIPGLLWSADATIGGRARMFFLDFIGGVKPYLMNEMRNNLGATTRITYAPSTKYYLVDQADPMRRWTTPLPFPVQVVARSESIDELSGGRLTTEYDYHHGYWDGAEREFRGFGRVDQRDTEVFETQDQAKPPETFSPPLETRTWFHQGPVGDEHGEWEQADYRSEYWPGDLLMLAADTDTTALLRSLHRRARRDALRTLRGSVLRTEIYALDGDTRESRPYTVTESVFAVRQEDAPDPDEADRIRIFFPHPAAQRTTQWERGDEPMTSFSFTDGYDAYGRPRLQTSIAVPRGRDPLATGVTGDAYLATVTEMLHATRDDETRYFADRVTRVTTWELVNDGSPTAEALHVGAVDGSWARRVMNRSLTYYDGEAFVGLPLSQLGDYGAVVRTERLVLTPEILRDAYRSGDDVAIPPELPPYLAPGGAPVWTAEYPPAFRAALPNAAGYVYRSQTSDTVEGYYAATERRRYDFHVDAKTACGLVVAVRAPLGRDGSVTYDRYGHRVTATMNAAGLSSTASYDYRTLQPALMTDYNGNRTAVTYTPLGLVASIAETGREAESAGDTLGAPGARFSYDLLAFIRSGQPASTRTVRRVYHATDTTVPAAERDTAVQTVDYTDGFGRTLQTRTQAEDVTFGDPVLGDAQLAGDAAAPIVPAVGQPTGPGEERVVVSGWQTYDNKGRVLERCEPFYATGWSYLARKDAPEVLFRNRIQTRFDPRGHAIRTINADGSEQRLILGIPVDLSDPDRFAPTPWEVYTYDANDNAGRSHPTQSAGYANHWNTPSSTVVDALGRAVLSVERWGPSPVTGHYRTRTTYDAAGNVLSIIDPLGRVAARHVYDLRGKALRLESADGGVVRLQLNAAGLETERRDAEGALTLRSYDALDRPHRIWARRDASAALTLRERLEYGDRGDAAQPTLERAAQAVANRLGRLHKYYDEAGLLTFVAYDLGGRATEEVRRVVSDDCLLGAVAGAAANKWRVAAFDVDWEVPAGGTLADREAALLDQREYVTSSTYNALGHPRLNRYPKDAAGNRCALQLRYNRASALESATLDGQTYVRHVAYNAKGQRTLIAYGNGIMTRYAYHPVTLRLIRLRTERYAASGVDPTLTFSPTAPGAPLYDCSYEYDLIGNVRTIVDRTPGAGTIGDPTALEAGLDPALGQSLAAGDAIIRRFEHDPLYRLTSATGRECTPAVARAPLPWADEPRCGFGSGAQGTPTQNNAPQLTTRYRERYTYDAVGNLTTLRHETPNAAWTRRFGFAGLAPAQWAAEWPLHVAAGAQWTGGTGNRLTHASDDELAPLQTHLYDARGNLVRQGVERSLGWDHAGRLRTFAVQTPAAGSSPADDSWAEPSFVALYLYDAGGQRVKKLIRSQGGGWESITYAGAGFEHRVWSSQAGPRESTTCNVMDGRRRIATIRTGDAHPLEQGPAVQLHLGDHLGSSILVVDGAGTWVNREEYTPYGETTFGSFSRKRYRFSGKERDAETGLCYHGARYYAPWLARWISCDPAGFVDGPNVYLYVRGRPLSATDPTGRQAAPQLTQGMGQAVRAIDIATARWGAAALISGGAAAQAGGLTVGAVAAAAAPYVIIGLGIAAIGWGGYQLYQYAKARSELAEAKQRLTETERRLAEQVDLMWKNGQITDEERNLFLATGNLVIQPRGSSAGPDAKAPAPKPEAKAKSGPARIPHSTGRPLKLDDFRRGGKASEKMLGESLTRVGIPFLEQKAIRDNKGDVMEPRRIIDFQLMDENGANPLDLTTPAQEGSSQKKEQIRRDEQHKVDSPDRTVQDEAGTLHDIATDVDHIYGYPILAPNIQCMN